MTIIKPRTSIRPFMNPAMLAMLMGIIAFGACALFIYNRTVDLNHALQTQQQALDALHAANTTLKNKLYQTLDTRHLQTLVQEKGFIKITAPHYLSLL